MTSNLICECCVIKGVRKSVSISLENLCFKDLSSWVCAKNLHDALSSLFYLPVSVFALYPLDFVRGWQNRP